MKVYLQLMSLPLFDFPGALFDALIGEIRSNIEFVRGLDIRWQARAKGRDGTLPSAEEWPESREAAEGDEGILESLAEAAQSRRKRCGRGLQHDESCLMGCLGWHGSLPSTVFMIIQP